MGTFDLAIILIYLIAMVSIGIACRGRQEDEEDYFTADGGFSRLFGSVLVGLSIAATFFSGISFLAYPSVAYSDGAAIGVSAAVLPIAGAIVWFWFLPRYLSTGSRQPYEIVERRFGYPARAVAAAMFVMLRVGWMGALIYAPTVAVMAAMRLPDSWFWPLVLTIGLTSTLYTTLGGIRGVIVTDAIQFVIIAVGVFWPIAYVATHLPVPAAEAWSHLESSGRLDWFDPSPDFRRPMTFWSVLFGFTAANLGMYIGDQMSLQRYLASSDLRTARRSFAINIVGVMIVVLMLTTVGLAMAIWYGSSTGPAAPGDADHVFPHFVATELPAGTPGLILAAILAATMSSMTSGINALAGTITLDFALRSNRLSTAKERLRFGRWASLVIGLAATLVAGLVDRLGSIFEITQALTGVFLGPLLACVVYAVTQLPIGPKSLIAGMLAGTLAGWAVVLSPVYILWVAPASVAVSFAIPLIAMALWKRERQSVRNEE